MDTFHQLQYFVDAKFLHTAFETGLIRHFGEEDIVSNSSTDDLLIGDFQPFAAPRCRARVERGSWQLRLLLGCR